MGRVVRVPVTATGVITNAVYGARSAEASAVTGAPVTTMILLNLNAPLSVAPGGLVTYTLQVTNPSPQASLKNLILQDSLPIQTGFYTATLPHTLAGDVITWSLPSLAPNATWEVELVVQAPNTFSGTLVNDGLSLQSEGIEPIAGPTASTVIQALRISKEVSALVVNPGDLLTYTLSVSNLHPVSATHHIILTDTLPLGTVFERSSTSHQLVGNTIRWETAELEPGNNWSVDLVVQVLPETSGTIENRAYAVRSAETPVWPGSKIVTSYVNFKYYLLRILNKAP